MVVIVAYDISREEVRGRVRRFLRNMGLSMVNRSVYAGVGGERQAKKIAERLKKLLEENDNAFIIVVNEETYNRAYIVTQGDYIRVQDRRYEII